MEYLTISQTSPSVIVFGAINIDLLATAGSEAIAGDSTPGTLRQFFGGVGRNIAENLARLGVNTKLVSAVGHDSFAAEVIAHATAAGIDTTEVVTSKEFPTASYTAIHNSDGELLHAVSDMRLFDQLTVELSDSIQSAISSADAVVIDANLPIAMIEDIVRLGGAKLIVADAVSAQKSQRLSGVLSSIDLLKVNRTEACALANVKPDVADGELVRAMLDHGSKEILATVGRDGVYLLSEDQTVWGLPVIEPNVVSTNGAGDALLAAVLAARLYGCDASDQLAWGMEAAAVTLLSDSACSESMSYQLILQKVREREDD